MIWYVQAVTATNAQGKKETTYMVSTKGPAAAVDPKLGKFKSVDEAAAAAPSGTQIMFNGTEFQSKKAQADNVAGTDKKLRDGVIQEGEKPAPMDMATFNEANPHMNDFDPSKLGKLTDEEKKMMQEGGNAIWERDATGKLVKQSAKKEAAPAGAVIPKAEPLRSHKSHTYKGGTVKSGGGQRAVASGGGRPFRDPVQEALWRERTDALKRYYAENNMGNAPGIGKYTNYSTHGKGDDQLVYDRASGEWRNKAFYGGDAGAWQNALNAADADDTNLYDRSILGTEPNFMRMRDRIASWGKPNQNVLGKTGIGRFVNSVLTSDEEVKDIEEPTEESTIKRLMKHVQRKY